MEIRLTRPLSAHDCLQRGLKSRKHPPLPVKGTRITAASGLSSRFTTDPSGVEGRRLAFECSPCATLIAYCQALVDIAGMEVIRPPTVQQLTAAVAGVPAAHHERAAVALAGYRALVYSLKTGKEPA